MTANYATLYSQVTKHVATRIVNGVEGYTPGDRIDADKVRGELGVTRSTIYAAFGQIANYGLITTRRRTGTVVRPIADWHLLNPNVVAWLAYGPDRHGLLPQLRQFAELLQERPLAENRFWLAAHAAIGGPP